MLFACASCKVGQISMSMKVQTSPYLQLDNIYMYISKQQVISCKSTATQSHGILFGNSHLFHILLTQQMGGKGRVSEYTEKLVVRTGQR